MSSQTDIKMERERFLASLIVKNNNGDEDQGVNLVLDTLTKEFPDRAMKNRHITKDKLMATLAFLTDLPLTSAKDKFNHDKVEVLIKKIISQFDLLCPDICLQCKKVYQCMDNDIGLKCFLCTKRLCNECAPEQTDNRNIYKLLFPLCRGCVDRNGGCIDMEPHTPTTTDIPDTENTDNTENTNTSNNRNIATEDNRNSTTDDSSNINICKFWIKRNCKHVKDRTRCNYSHPKMCNSWLKKGYCTN